MYTLRVDGLLAPTCYRTRRDAAAAARMLRWENLAAPPLVRVVRDRSWYKRPRRRRR
jgi:hypothetical protein